ncbi:hypothetical protein OWR29_05220 [Actinoplanes sp. Pm04-4]|uniref:Lipoprotein n=1 Tax=Paractinoplanes pyxinae TaxID=2997416 RepID=A0ABT4AT14_9ACTN|nr:hypothetical protein [Actinoplanes pyxinae]MCY1137392.1 hypothetical protein [Actinoplanes pyxinae]
MLRSIAVTAGALSLALLLAGGCSSDDDKPAASAPAPVSADGSVGGSVPAPGASGPAAPLGSAPDAAAPGGQAAQPGTADSTAKPSRPAGHDFPDVGAMRVGWVNATVTRAGGSCYGLKTADGETWAAYSKKAVPMDKGDKVRVRITPGKTPVDCGSGKPATLVRALINPK